MYVFSIIFIGKAQSNVHIFFRFLHKKLGDASKTKKNGKFGPLAKTYLNKPPPLKLGPYLFLTRCFNLQWPKLGG